MDFSGRRRPESFGIVAPLRHWFVGFCLGCTTGRDPNTRVLQLQDVVRGHAGRALAAIGKVPNVRKPPRGTAPQGLDEDFNNGLHIRPEHICSSYMAPLSVIFLLLRQVSTRLRFLFEERWWAATAPCTSQMSVGSFFVRGRERSKGSCLDSC